MRSAVSLGLLALTLGAACARPPVDRSVVSVEKGFSCYTYTDTGRANEDSCFATAKECERDRSDRRDRTNECAPAPHAYCLSFTSRAGNKQLHCFVREEGCEGIGTNDAKSDGATNISRCEQL